MRIVRCLHNLMRDLVNRRSQLLHGACLLRSALRQRLRAAGNLLRAAGNLLGGTVDLAKRIVEGIENLIDRGADRRPIAKVFHIGGNRQVALRHLQKQAGHIIDILGKRLGDKAHAVSNLAKLILGLISNRGLHGSLCPILRGRLDLC